MYQSADFAFEETKSFFLLLFKGGYKNNLWKVLTKNVFDLNYNDVVDYNGILLKMTVNELILNFLTTDFD